MIDDHVSLSNLKQEEQIPSTGGGLPNVDDDCSTVISTNTDTTTINAYNTLATTKQQHSTIQQFNPTCPLCNKTFANSSNLKHHMNTIHFNEAKWICKECGKVCTSKSNLKVHLRVHLRVKPYYCRWCDYNCMHHSSIRDHLSKCHPDKSHNSCEPGYIFNSQAVPEPESSICEMPPTLCVTPIKQQQLQEHVQQQDNDEDNDAVDTNQDKKITDSQEQQQQQSSSRRRKRKLDNVFLNKFRLQKDQSKQQSNGTITSNTSSPLSPSASHNSSSVSPISSLSSSNGSPHNMSQLQLAQQQSNAFYLNNMAAAAFIHRMNTTAALMQQLNNPATNGGLLLPLKQQQQRPQCPVTPKKGLLLKKFLKKSKLNMISGSNPLDLSLTNGTYYSEEGENEFEGDNDENGENDDQEGVETCVEGDACQNLLESDENQQTDETEVQNDNDCCNDTGAELWSPESLDCKLKLKQALLLSNGKTSKCPSKITRDTQTYNSLIMTNIENSCSSSSSSSDLESPNNSNSCSYKCTYCNIIFNDYELYSLHMGMHGTNNPWQCNVCSSVCFNKVDFAVHILHLPKK